MKYFFLASVLVLGLFSCSNTQFEKMNSQKESVIDNEITKTANTIEENFIDTNQDPITSKVPVDQEDLLLQIININLDLDPLEEQVLVLKTRDNPSSSIRVAVVDFDSVTNNYKISWEGETKAVNIRSFIVDFDDIIGDLTLSIICYGIDYEGRQTLDLFWRTTAPQGILLFYKPVFGLSAAGTIEIQEQERSKAYKLKQKTGTSFPILSLEHDPESSNNMDLVKTTYYWDFQIREYVEGEKEKIAGKAVEDQQLRDLFRKGEKEFETFLSGVWFKSDTKIAAPAEIDNLVLFDNMNREIIFYSSNTQEIFSWENSFRTLYNALSVTGSNVLVPFIKRQTTVRVLTVNSIQLSGSDLWQGIYTRLSDNIYLSLVDRNIEKRDELPVITGFYQDESGDEYSFLPPLFSATIKGEKVKGGFSIFSMGNTILSMKIFDAMGLIKEEKTYKIDFMENVSKNEIKRTLYMIPGTIFVSGFKPSSSEVLKLEQREIIE